MDNQEEKNYAKQSEETNEVFSGGKISIHTMPKRYMVSLPSTSNAKSTGLLILVLGFLFLIVALFVLYFYVLKKPAKIDLVSEEPLQTATTTEQKPVTNKPNPSTTTSTSTKPTPDTTNNNIPTTTEQMTASSSGGVGSIDGSSLGNKKYQTADDSDRDGLTDIEEYLLGSSPNSQDTDSDGYQDGLEVLNLYDPTSRGRIVDSLGVEALVNEEYNFLLFKSSLWTVEKVSGNDSLIISLGKDQFIQVVSQNKSEEQSLDEWYKHTLDTDEVLDSQRFKKGNWNGIMVNDKLTVYLEHPNLKHIITLNYVVGDDTTLYYRNIFDMMLQSIAINE
jgi:hypothetical protein